MANLLINTTVGGNAVITTSNIGTYALTSIPATIGPTNINIGNAIYFGGGNNYLNWSGSRINSNVGIQSAVDMVAPIFYDSDNGAYYGDFASTSVMNAIRFGTSTNNGTLNGAGDWGMRLTTNHGWIQFGPANSSHAHIYTDRPNFYFNADLLVNGNTVLTAASYNSYSPTLTGSGASGTWGINVTGTAGSAPANGGTSSNTNSISNALGNTHTWTGYNYFQSNLGATSGAVNSPPLQVFCTGGNSAFMSFHRSGNYAVNFGLDSDNVLRMGGWSASANRWQLDMSGNMTVAGDVTAFSDARVKTNVQTIENALAKTLALRGVSYNRTDSDDTRTKIGVIAQETLEVVPEVVNQDNDGMYNVSYGNMTALLIEAIKEQQAQIEDLKSEIKKLRGE